MGGHINHGEAMDWPEENEKFFLEILAERVKRDPNGTPVFKGTDWIEIDEIIFLKFALRYGPEKLKAKYFRMRTMHTKFNELISNTGVTWDSNSGQVFANDTIWDDYLKRDKIFKTLKKKGCKLYPLLGMVFNNSSATGTFRNASTAAPQTSEEEQIMEQEYLGVNEESTSNKGKRSVEGDSEYFPGNRRVKKNLGKDKFDALMDVWSQSIVARTEKDVAKAERYKSKSSEVTSSTTEEFSIKDCMAVLDSMEDVGTMSYNKAIEYFLDLNWRKIFLLMPENRRKGWVDNLK